MRFVALLNRARPSHFQCLRGKIPTSQMHTGSMKASLSHEERTADEPRDSGLYHVVLDKITPVNDQLKMYKFKIQDPKGINFLPGQWLDVHVPGIEKAGGFTITSAPRCAVPPSPAGEPPYLELAIQKSPSNPPAAWLWQRKDSILGKQVNVRVGGSFVWPPPNVGKESFSRAIFIAGGVGINPLISMISHIAQGGSAVSIRLLYSTKVLSRDFNSQEVLFLPRILDLVQARRISLDLFLTGIPDENPTTISSKLIDEHVSTVRGNHPGRPSISVHSNRIDRDVLMAVVGQQHERAGSVFYVCGPPDMTDSIVQQLRDTDDVASERVFCEKWW